MNIIFYSNPSFLKKNIISYKDELKNQSIVRLISNIENDIKDSKFNYIMMTRCWIGIFLMSVISCQIHHKLLDR